LGLQNQCLLLKILHRLSAPAGSAWARWMRRHINLATLEGNVAASHWNSLRALLPLYRAITTVEVQNGVSTSFWEDSWLASGPLAESLPALYSHATVPGVSVATALHDGIDAFLQPRLTSAGAVERATLDHC
jgi:hypothetical protein